MKLASFKLENSKLKLECEICEKNNDNLSNKVCGLQEKVSDLQQYSRNHNIEI